MHDDICSRRHRSAYQDRHEKENFSLIRQRCFPWRSDS